MMGRVLVVDDESAVGESLCGTLERADYEAEWVGSAVEGLARAERSNVDVVITDLRMPGMDGQAFLVEMQRRSPGIPVIMHTGHGTIPDAVAAMQAGAFSFVTKGASINEILDVVGRAMQVVTKVTKPPSRGPAGMIVASDAMRACVKELEEAAQSKKPVLLQGETGSGKEGCARALHELSPRKSKPFITVNASALSANLLESELFGSEPGAYTGATSRPGRVKLADGGTFFLDEIGEIPFELQPKLHRLLQQNEIQRVGGTRIEKVDARFVAATSKDLREAVAKSAFRQDLLFRFTFFITVPPLRARVDDVAPLAHHFAKRAAEGDSGPITFTEGALAKMRAHSWPGNVRELESLVERLSARAAGKARAEIDEQLVSRELARFAIAREPSPAGGTLAEARAKMDRDAVLEALERAHQNRTKAARALGISRRSLYYLMEEHGIQ